MNNILKYIHIRTGFAAALLGLALLATGCEKDADPAVAVSCEEMLLGTQAQNIAVTVHSNTDWSAQSNQAWCTLSQSSGRGTTDIRVMCEPNIAAASRTARITVTTAAGQKSYIAINQAGLISTGFRITPRTITLGAKVTTGNAFTVVSQYSDAVITAAVTGYAASGAGAPGWISNLQQSESVDGYTRTALFTFDAAENTDAYERTATVTVTIQYARQTYTETVTVIQAGLGAPAVSTPMNVYLTHSQISHTQNVWVEGGDQTNVRYECHVSCNNCWTGSEEVVPWITGAAIDQATGRLTITTLPNPLDEVREGDVLIVAYRNNATTRINVHVVQSGHMAAGMHLASSMVSHHAARADYQLAVNALNNSTLSVAGNNSGGWLHTASIEGNNMLNYSLDAYDGAQGAYREATVILKASNGHLNAQYSYLTVRQYAPEAAGISLPVTMQTHNAGAVVNYQLQLNPLNGSRVEVVNASKAWIYNPAINVDGNLRYGILAYDGSEGDYREAVITLKATNAHANAAYYYVVVRQYAPAAAGMSLPASELVYDYTGGAKFLLLNALNGSTVTHMNTLSVPSWIRNVSIGGNNGYLGFTLDPFTGGQAGDSRQFTFVLRARNTGHNDAYYYVTVRQLAPSMPSVSIPVSVLTHDSSGGDNATGLMQLPIAIANGTTVRPIVDASTAEWIRYPEISSGILTFQVQPNTSTADREGVICLEASNANADKAMYYVTVRQYGETAAGIQSLPSYIGLDCWGTYAKNAYGESVAASGQIPLAGSNGTTSFSATSSSWITASITSGVLTYTVAPFTGVQSEPMREGYIMVTATKSIGNSTSYYITVRQYGDGHFATLSPSVWNVGQGRVTQGFAVQYAAHSTGLVVDVSQANLVPVSTSHASNPNTHETFLTALNVANTSFSLRVGAIYNTGLGCSGCAWWRSGYVYVTITGGRCTQTLTLQVNQSLYGGQDPLN